MRRILWPACFIAATIIGQAGTLPFGSASSTPLTFTPGSPGQITWSGAISGTGTLVTLPLAWSISDSPSNLLTWTGGSSPFALSQGAGAVTLTVNDGVFGDKLTGALIFTEAVSSNFMGVDLTDLEGTFTFLDGSPGTSVTTGALVTYLNANFGGVPTAGETGTFDLFYSCGVSTPCVSATDPTGAFQSADITFSGASGVPEPGTLALLGGGLAAMVLIRLKLRP